MSDMYTVHRDAKDFQRVGNTKKDGFPLANEVTYSETKASARKVIR